MPAFLQHKWALGWDSGICPWDPSQSPDLLSWKTEPSVTLTEWHGRFHGQKILLWSPLPFLGFHKSSVETSISKASFCSVQGHTMHGGRIYFWIPCQSPIPTVPSVNVENYLYVVFCMPTKSSIYASKGGYYRLLQQLTLVRAYKGPGPC